MRPSMLTLSVMLLVFVMLLSGCCSEALWGRPLQPVVLFYVERNDENDARLRIIAGELAMKHSMRHDNIDKPERGFNSGRLFAATRNSWLYYQCLASADDAEFYSRYHDERRIDLVVVGPPDHAIVHGLVADWTNALDTASIEYEKVVRQPLQPVSARW